MKQQNCLLCEVPFYGKGEEINDRSRDYCHETGKFRGAADTYGNANTNKNKHHLHQ